MMKVILDFARTALRDYKMPVGKVLEVGSYDMNGSPREVFQDKCESYLGVDIQPGPTVDLVCDAEELDQCTSPNFFDTAISMECLEHAVRPWVILDKMKTALKTGGHLWISTPTYGFPLHRCPIDTFRFGEDAYRLWIFAGMDLLRLQEVRDELGQPALVGVARKK